MIRACLFALALSATSVAAQAQEPQAPTAAPHAKVSIARYHGTVEARDAESVRIRRPNGESVTVRITDRGPFVASRCLDLSRGAFRQIASLGAGVLPKSQIKYEVLE